LEYSLTPSQRYQADLEQGKILPDPAQAHAVDELQLVYDALLRHWQSNSSAGKLSLFRRVFNKSVTPVRGLYFWGGVGRGKTYLMDLFFHCLPSERKKRMHFHRFMQMVHQGLNARKQQKNPLHALALELAEEIDVICFDEFFVSDIGDAMILGNLMQTLLTEGVTLIATSNIEPQRLYENGLQRTNFLPAIALIKQYTRIVNIDSGVDYRLRSLEQAELYHSPLDAVAERQLHDYFEKLSAGLESGVNHELEILGRSIRSRLWSADLVWFEFAEICDGPRSAADYIEIAQTYHSVIISNVPQFNEYKDDMARRFVSLVDEFYDHKVKLILSAAVPLKDIYQGSELKFVFERTRSRLLEMQSHEYLALQHRL